MIIFDQVTMTVTTHARTAHARTRAVLSSVNLVIPSDRRIALLGPSILDNRLFLNLLGGIILPRAGRIVRKAKVSFPVGHLGGFAAKLPVRSNVAHLARVYGADVATMVEFVERVAGLGPSFNKPFMLLSSSMKRHLGRIVGYAIPFDLYVLTEEIVRGKNKDRDISYDLFQARSRTAGMIIPTDSAQFAREHCEMALVLYGGQLILFDQVEKALSALLQIQHAERLIS